MKKTYVIFLLVILLLSCIMYYSYIIKNEVMTDNDRSEIKIERFIEKYENTTIDMSDFEFKNTKLIFSFSEECCDHCITELFELINETNFFSPSDIVILTSFHEERKLNVFLKYHKIRSNVINVNEMRNLPFNELRVPYFFVYNPLKKRMQSFFIPVIDDKQNTLKYLETIKSELAID